MRRREFITFMGGVAVAWPLAAQAQQTKNIPRLCFLTFDPVASRSTRFGAFFEGLVDLGYVDGQTINIDYLSADGRGERYGTLAAECLRLKADIIAVSTTPAAQARQEHNPHDSHRHDRAWRPCRNWPCRSSRPAWRKRHRDVADGFRCFAAKRLELLKEAVPAISRVLVLSYLRRPNCAIAGEGTGEGGPLAGRDLREIQDIRTADDLPTAFEAGARERTEGLLTTAESLFVAQRARVSELAARYRLPAMYPFTIQAEAGGLMAYDTDYPDLVRRAATYVDKDFEGRQAL